MRILKVFPYEVKRAMGYALYQAQIGRKHPDAKPLKGFSGAGVLEVVEDFDGNTYRTVYTLKFADAIYVLHAFQKKAKRGIATLQRELKVVEARLKRVQELYARRASYGRESDCE